MKSGKLSPRELEENIFSVVSTRRAETLLSAAAGEDCAVIKANGLVYITVDPITAAESLGADIGRLAIVVSCNDIAAAGAEPVAVVLLLLMPKNYDSADVKNIMLSAESAAKDANIDIVGGHTEFTSAVVRPVISATVVGKSTGFTQGVIKSGDAIIITKTVGIEGTWILAETAGLQGAELTDARKYSDNLSVVKDGMIAAQCGISRMHDITEGGVLGAVAEILMPNGLGADIYLKDIPITDLTSKICKKLDINPYKLISSGSMLIVAPEADKVIRNLKESGISAARIGTVTEGGLQAIVGKTITTFGVEPDEINKII